MTNLDEIRARDRDAVPRMLPPDGNDPLLRAEMDRRWLLEALNEAATEGEIRTRLIDLLRQPRWKGTKSKTTRHLKRAVYDVLDMDDPDPDTEPPTGTPRPGDDDAQSNRETGRPIPRIGHTDHEPVTDFERGILTAAHWQIESGTGDGILLGAVEQILGLRYAAIRGVLASHQRAHKPGGPCFCGEWPAFPKSDTWMDHVLTKIQEATS